jgi:ribosomal protein S18 acetylase RimI-like enzyme
MDCRTITLKTGKVVTCRLLQSGDEEALRQFNTGLSVRSRDLFTPHSYSEETLRKIIARTEEGKDRGYIVFDKNRCIAYCYLWYFDKDYPLLGLGIIDDYQDKGLGRRLLALMLDDGEKAGKAGVELTTDFDNGRAKTLYESVGFMTLGTVENIDGDGSRNEEYHMFYSIVSGATPPERTLGPPV